MPINDLVRQAVHKRADFVCEYCHSPERLSANRFTIDHIIPVSLSGSDEIDNLALACRRCNERRSNFVAGIDPETSAIAPLFNPRQQSWNDHFCWIDDGVTIFGVTDVGRATCIRLDLNDTRYPDDDSIRATRRFWIKAGVHPPEGDRVRE